MNKLFNINKNDLFLGAGLLLGALCLWCIILFVQKNREQTGLIVVVTVDGEEYYRGSLDSSVMLENGDNTEEYILQFQKQNRKEIDINGHNKVIIEGGKVWMDGADCPDKLCVSQGKISKSGQAIICLPNKVMVTIKGGKSEYDGVAQ